MMEVATEARAKKKLATMVIGCYTTSAAAGLAGVGDGVGGVYDNESEGGSSCGNSRASDNVVMRGEGSLDGSDGNNEVGRAHRTGGTMVASPKGVTAVPDRMVVGTEGTSGRRCGCATLCVAICVVLPVVELLDVVPKVVVLSGKTTGLTVVVLSAVVVLGWGSVWISGLIGDGLA